MGGCGITRTEEPLQRVYGECPGHFTSVAIELALYFNKRLLDLRLIAKFSLGIGDSAIAGGQEGTELAKCQFRLAVGLTCPIFCTRRSERLLHE